MTCYYYRGAYYKSHWASPPACAVGKPQKNYRGEQKLPLILQNVHRYFLYAALLFLVFLSWDAYKGFFHWGEDHHFELRVGSLVLLANVILLAGYTFGCHSLRHLVGGGTDEMSKRPLAHEAVEVRDLLQPPPSELGLGQPALGGRDRPLRAPVRDGRDLRLEDPLMADHEVHEYDVLVIGAGGAGLRAAIEASAAGVKVGLVCKSLLGKAHTVMAEGGVAAALANVDERDSWQVHFADTMRGGQYLNNWRMAELHAKEAPDRVRELEAWGAVFDRTPDGRILQRNFGGHRYPRLAHVGDRTGLEMIRTLQDHGIHQGIDVHMECTVTALLKDGDRIAGAFGYEREKRLLHAVPGQGGGAGHRRHRARLQDHLQQLGVHRRRPGAGLRRRRRADGHGVRPVPSRPAWCGRRACAASWSPRACAARAACCATARASASCSTTSRRSTAGRPRTTPRRAGATSRATRTRGARPSC